MQNFLTLIKKELLIYFSGISAYFLIFAYLCVSFGGAFYFGGYLAEKNNALYSLFSLQPYILILFIPAVTMRLWAEEYKTNSAEFLLTLPEKTLKIIMAKFCFASGLFIFLSLGLLPIIIYSATWHNLDWCSVCSSYLGLWLLIILLSAFGCFISSLNKNLIIAYILNIFVLIPLVFITKTGIISAYRDFLFAEVGFFDLFYFISFSALFLFFNLLCVLFRRNMQKNSLFGLLLLFLAATIANALICWGLSVSDRKFDFTSSGLYSLKNVSKQLVNEIKKPTDIKLYISEDFYQRDYAASHYFEQVKRFLKRYQSASEGMIKVEAKKVEAYSDLENELLAKGFYVTKNEAGSKNYFGAIIENNENINEVIRLFLPQRQAYLEEDIDRALLKTAFPELKKNIGIYFDAAQNLDDYEGIGLILENEYNALILDNTSYQIHNTAEAVILFNPKRLSSVFLYALDQYVMNGGKLIVFLDRNTQNQFDNINDEPLSIMRLLNHWGIEIEKEPFKEGYPAGRFGIIKQPLAIQSAYDISIDEEKLQAEPVLVNGDKMLGSIINGSAESFYNANPFANTPIGEYMRPFKSKTANAKIAVIGDADILDENNWIDEKSADRDIFGAIEKAGNGRFIKYLVDYIVGNEIYLMLPQNTANDNNFSLSDKVRDNTKVADEQQYQKLQTEAENAALEVWLLAEQKDENVWQAVNMTEAGRHLQSLNEQINNIEYNRAERYNRFMLRLMILFILVLPLFESLLILFGFKLIRWRLKRKFKGVL